MKETSTEQTDRIEELIDAFDKLADEAGERADKRESQIDFSEVDTSHMAAAEKRGMEQAFQQAWQLAISKRDESPGDSSE